MLIKSLFHAAGRQGTPKKPAPFVRSRRKEWIRLSWGLPRLLMLSTHLQLISYAIKLGALCLQPAIARQWVRDRPPPPAYAQTHPLCWRMDGKPAGTPQRAAGSWHSHQSSCKGWDCDFICKPNQIVK